MKVIKAVEERDGKLFSVYASGEWRKEYAKGVVTTPDTGYLFAYPEGDSEKAKFEFGCQCWVAEAEVVHSISWEALGMSHNRWHSFWEHFKPASNGYEYLLCSSITLISEVE